MIHVYTDGACKGNPGPGGWGAVILRKEGIVELGGHALETTNNRMELTGVISALQFLAPTTESMVVFTDSRYTLDGIQHWVHNWLRRGWKTADGKPVKNKDLFLKLYELAQSTSLKWVHVRGHSDDPGNERADAIASAMAVAPAQVMLFQGPAKDYPYPCPPLP